MSTPLPSTPEECLAEASKNEQEAQDSFDRCDTDGFLSQWASGIMASLYRTQASILEAGGIYEFPALFDLEGNWIPAKVIRTQFGKRWMLLDENGKATGEFAPYLPMRRSTMTKRGLLEGSVMRPAKAELESSGYGMSGSCWIAVKSTTPEHEAPLSIVCADRWNQEGE